MSQMTLIGQYVAVLHIPHQASKPQVSTAEDGWLSNEMNFITSLVILLALVLSVGIFFSISQCCGYQGLSLPGGGLCFLSVQFFVLFFTGFQVIAVHFLMSVFQMGDSFKKKLKCCWSISYKLHA